MSAKIKKAVDCKNSSWQAALDQVVRDGHAKSLRGITLPGLPEGGRYEYKSRAPEGRVYLTYKTSSQQWTIGSVAPEFANEALRWKPSPHCEQRFEFKSGAVVVYYDAHALPFRIVAER